MPLRFIMRYLANHPHVIEKLAESYPIRRAAQLTAYLYHRGRLLGQEIKESDAVGRAQNEASHLGRRLEFKAKNFSKTFSDELKEGFKNVNKEIKDKEKK